VRQAHEPIDEAAQVVAQLGRGHPAGERRLVADRDLRQHPGELGRGEPTVLALAGGKRFRQRQAEALERADVDEVADLRAPEEGAQLVREDLLGRVDADDTVQRLLRPQLLRVLDDEIDDDRL